ncbi:hypothetical protein R1sor_010641 [Riccia sorocarpa]|uniref:Uncharacterized protein n=1 Tax=Riccia sorocarpa TaxID=122646 RepID=A0ABD3I280_9MARC
MADRNRHLFDRQQRADHVYNVQPDDSDSEVDASQVPSSQHSGSEGFYQIGGMSQPSSYAQNCQVLASLGIPPLLAFTGFMSTSNMYHHQRLPVAPLPTSIPLPSAPLPSFLGSPFAGPSNFNFNVSGGKPSRPVHVLANIQYSATVGEPSRPTPVHSNVQVLASSRDPSKRILVPSGEGTSARVVDLDQDAEPAIVANGGTSQPARPATGVDFDLLLVILGNYFLLVQKLLA